MSLWLEGTRGDAVLITQMEHHANIVPWQILCREREAELRYLEVDERGELSLQALRAELARGDVAIVAFTHVSNVLGTINPVAEMVAEARAAGVVSLIDGAQAVPQMPVDVEAIGADFYAWTGHKALGPTGIGVLHGRRELLERMEPFLESGVYANNLGEEDGNRVASAYGPNYGRLARIKGAWGPDNLFRLNHNIVPLSST